MLASTLSSSSWTDLSPMLRSLYETADSSPSPKGRMPLIGLTCHHTEASNSVNEAYSEAILQAGGLPVLLPTEHTTEHVGELLDSLDGLLLTGGGDIHSPFMGKELTREVGSIDVWRDRFELVLILEASRRNIPILGICRGLQIYNVAMGGSLIQDIATEYPQPSIGHDPKMDKEVGCHAIRLAEGDNPLAQVLGVAPGDELMVNSLHHQALGELAIGLRALAHSSDGIVEAATALPHKNFLGVQWHPEHLVRQPEGQCMRGLFTYLVQEARLYAQAKALHQSTIVLDSHTDTPMFFTPDTDLSHWGDTLVDLQKMRVGKVASTVMAAYLPQGECTEEGHTRAQQHALQKLAEIHKYGSAHPSLGRVVTSLEEIKTCYKQGLCSILPAIENGYAIGRNLSILQRFRDLGVFYITLCHNGDNEVCDSARHSEHRHHGLSAFGREVVLEMNRLGILVDISHAAPETVTDVLALSSQPIIASHSSCYALCPHPRNLSDEHIRAIASAGGVVQVCLYAGFIAEKEEEATVQRAVDHIEHIIEIAGVQAVGIGSDFDGDGRLIGCQGSQDLINLTLELLRRGHTEEEFRAIFGGNFLRVLTSVGR